MIDLRQLRALDAIARHGSMAAASRALDWSQPTLAHHVHTLEAYLKVPVVHRLRKGSELTPAGVALLPFAARVLELVASGEQAARAAEPVKARLTVGVFSTAGAYLLPPAIPVLQRQGIAVDILEDDDAVALQHALARGSADAAILYGLSGEEMPQVPGELLREPLFVVLPSSHRLAGEDEVSIGELAGENWIMGKSPGDPSDIALMRLSEEAGFQPRCVLRTDDFAVIQGYVSAEIGIALVPSMALQFTGPDVRVVKLSGSPAERVIRLKVAPHAVSMPAVAALESALRKSAMKLAKRLAESRGQVGP